MKLLLADGKEYSLASNIVDVRKEFVNNAYLDCILFNVIAPLNEIREDFKNQENLSFLTFIDDEGKLVSEFNGYQKLVNISIPVDNKEKQDVYRITLGLTDDVKELIKSWSATVKNISVTVQENTEATESAIKTVDNMKETIEEIVGKTDITEMTLEDAISYKIKQSKIALSEFLENSSIASTCHKSERAEYSVTSEKQQYLISMITIAELANNAGVEYQPSWNAKGQPCSYDWTIEELKQLAFEMESFVRPLVSKQQEIEVTIKNCKSVEEVIAVEFNY